MLSAADISSAEIILTDALGSRLVPDIQLSRYSTARVGGPARWLFRAKTEEDMVVAVEAAVEADIPFIVIGGGSNILVSDNGFDGLVILNQAKDISWSAEGASINCRAESGVTLSALARKCNKRGYGGLEWAVSVPGTVGGAVYGNAGAHGSEIKDVVSTVSVWLASGGRFELTRDEMDFGYRDSIFKRASSSKQLILAANFNLHHVPAEVLQAFADDFQARRQMTQPAGATMGSIFKNPPEDHAGRIIEAAGLKGLQIGKAYVSPMHANFIINDGGATAAEIKALIDEVRSRVLASVNIELQLEIELVGAW